METEKCINVLDQLANLKPELNTIVFPMFYDEPTLHPSFRKIMKHFLAKGLFTVIRWDLRMDTVLRGCPILTGKSLLKPASILSA
jgi:hypothetical protein